MKQWELSHQCKNGTIIKSDRSLLDVEVELTQTLTNGQFATDCIEFGIWFAKTTRNSQPVTHSPLAKAVDYYTERKLCQNS